VGVRGFWPVLRLLNSSSAPITVMDTATMSVSQSVSLSVSLSVSWEQMRGAIQPSICHDRPMFALHSPTTTTSAGDSLREVRLCPRANPSSRSFNIVRSVEVSSLTTSHLCANPPPPLPICSWQRTSDPS